MVKVGKNIIIIGILLVLIFFMFDKCGDVKERVVTKIDTSWQVKYDTFYRNGKNIKYKKLNTDYSLKDTGYNSEKVNIHDTPFIVNDYNQVLAYSDTIRKDSNVFIINDTISQNKIQSRGFKSSIVEKTITITNDIYHKQKNELYLGLVGDVRMLDNKIGVGVGLLYKKKKEVYSFSYTTNQFSIGLHKKIF